MRGHAGAVGAYHRLALVPCGKAHFRRFADDAHLRAHRRGGKHVDQRADAKAAKLLVI